MGMLLTVRLAVPVDRESCGAELCSSVHEADGAGGDDVPLTGESVTEKVTGLKVVMGVLTGLENGHCRLSDRGCRGDDDAYAAGSRVVDGCVGEG